MCLIYKKESGEKDFMDLLLFHHFENAKISVI